MGRARLTDDEKKVLQAHGLMDAFVKRREELKASGLSPYDARQQTLCELVTPEMYGETPMREESKAEPLKVAPSIQEGDLDGVDFGAVALDVLDYVFQHMDNTDASVKEAPSVGAYGYLRQCQLSIKLRESFYTIYHRRNEKIEAAKGHGDDGRKLIEMCQRVRGAMERAKKKAVMA